MEFQDWSDVQSLIYAAESSAEQRELFSILLTEDERNALIARVNILNELLKGDLTQRQLSQALGVGIATVTRGSNEIKRLSDVQKTQLQVQLSHAIHLQSVGKSAG